MIFLGCGPLILPGHHGISADLAGTESFTRPGAKVPAKRDAVC